MSAQRQVVLVVCDSLRADMVDADVTPTLERLRRTGAHYAKFRGVFPSTTRTSAASIATGCHPATHGLLGNTMVLDEGAGLVCVSAGKPDFLDRLRKATGRALARPTLHERVRPLGEAVVMSNVSPGAAYVHDPEGAGFVYHRSGSFGPGRLPLRDGLDIQVGAPGDRAMTERFCDEVLGRRAPPYAVLWLSEPDHTAHHHPLGSPAHHRAMGEADANVARVLDAVARHDPRAERTLVAVCSDHGMQTIRRKIDVAQQLVQAGLKESLASRDIVVAPQGTAVLIHFAPEALGRLQPALDWLGRQDFAGDIATGEQLVRWGLPTGGTLAVAVGLAGDHEPNDHGIPGRSDVAENALGGESLPGHGQHGGLAPYEQQPFLALAGGGLTPGQRDIPASLIDLAPTFLTHLGLPVDHLEGRALA